MTYEELWLRLCTRYDTGEAKAIIRWMLDVRFGLSLTDIYSGKVTQLSSDDQTELQKIMLRLEKGEPVQYVVGVADFCGRPFHVGRGVLIPRPETAELCRWIIDSWSEAHEAQPAVCHALDIGTGSGCIAITLALDLPQADVCAWDISGEALRMAEDNAESHGADVTFEKKDALNLTADGRSWNLIVSNPPYIELKERDGMAGNVLDYEPHEALFAPEDQPIAFYQRIGDYAWQTLQHGGLLYFELNPRTASDVGNYLQQLGFRHITLRNDEYGKQRFLKAIKL